MSLNLALSLDILWGVMLAFVAMAIYGACMLTVAAAAKGMSSAPGSLLSVAAWMPIGIIIVLMHWADGQGVSVPTLWSVVAITLVVLYGAPAS
ncbi:MAG: hypothetical protein H7322_06235 [Ramlibacter sp.]|nr:hypothetical protein [Ramlibacter sp.]